MIKNISAALLALVLLVSCGGGGGGGDGGGGGGGNGLGSLQFTADTTRIDLAYDEGALSMPGARVIVTATGNFTGTLYIGAIADGTGIDPNIQTEITGNQATFTFAPRAGLAIGTYTGKVSLMGCSDQACAKQIGNSPIIVNYTVTVRATLKSTPAQVDATSSSGNTTSQDIAIRLPYNATTFTASVSSGSEYISIDQQTAAGFRVALRSLPQGNYSGRVHVTAGTSAIDIPVSYVVAGGVPRANMQVTPNNLTMTGVEGAVSAPVKLSVTPPSWDPVTRVRFTSTSSSTSAVPTWLSASATTGGYNIVVDATSLTAGTFTAYAWVAGGYPTQEVSVPIALTVGPGLVRPADVIQDITSETTVAALSGTVPVTVAAGPVSNWTAASSVPWLRLTDASGATGESLAWEIDATLLAGLPNGAEYVAHITITPQRTTMSPAAFDIHARKHLAAVTSVGPYLMPTLQPTSRIILRGYGFTGVDDLAARLQFAGGTVNSVTLVNDTEVVVATGPLTNGSFLLSFSNALNQPAASARLKTFVPTILGPASAPTGGNLRGLFYDAERLTAYAVNVDLESLQRFKATNGWVTDSIAVPAILSAGLTQDGSRLLVASTTSGASRIRQLDPDDYTIERSSTDVQALARNFTYITGVIQTTNDGRAWFATGTGWNAMTYFDPVALTLNTFKPNIQTDFYGGPWFAASRDGERLLVPQSGSITPAPLALYLDAADSVLHANPAGLTNTYRMSMSDDGNRWVSDSYEVRDRDYTLIGRLPALPPIAAGPTYHVSAAQMSPDGKRVYSVAYPDTSLSAGNPARIYVFDSSTRQTTSSDLPVLGYYDMPDYPSCTYYSNQNCMSVTHMAISPDGLALFAAGNLKFVVMPAANATLTPMPLVQSGAQKLSRGRTMPWKLELSGR